MNALTELRESISKIIVVLLWLHVPVTAAAAMMVGGDWIGATIGSAVFAAIPTALWKLQNASLNFRFAVAVSYVVQIGLLVYVFSGHPWQIDVHMYFFAALAIIGALCCWQTIIVGTATIALHHLILNFALPLAVFPEGADFFRVVLHAVVVIFEAAVLTWLAFKLVKAFNSSSEAVEIAQSATSAAEVEKQRALEATEEAKNSEAHVMELKAEAERLNDERIQAGSLEQERAKQDRHAVAQAFEESVGNIVKTVAENSHKVTNLAANLQSISSEVTGKVKQASYVTENMSGSVQSVSSATEELSASIQEISTQLNQSSQIASSASKRASATSETMTQLKDAAQQISEVVGLISDIAEQTNLLALNATIEAARAGEAGKGFAVVASEVKNLATQTARATEDITSQVSGIQQVSEKAAEEIESILETINEISSTTSSVASAVEEQTAATNEISASTGKAFTGTVEVKSEVSEIEGFVTRSSSAADDMLAASNELVADADKVQSEVAGFLQKIRA